MSLVTTWNSTDSMHFQASRRRKSVNRRASMQKAVLLHLYSLLVITRQNSCSNLGTEDSWKKCPLQGINLIQPSRLRSGSPTDRHACMHSKQLTFNADFSVACQFSVLLEHLFQGHHRRRNKNVDSGYRRTAILLSSDRA